MFGPQTGWLFSVFSGFRLVYGNTQHYMLRRQGFPFLLVHNKDSGMSTFGCECKRLVRLIDRLDFVRVVV